MTTALARARAWLHDEVDPDDRRELSDLCAAAERGDAAAVRDLDDRFQGPLEFGTAGLRGLLGAGESRMNTAVVLRATWGLVQHVLEVVPDARTRGVVIGHDARLRSDALAVAAVEVALALGVKVYHLPGYSPTPLVAFAAKHLGAAAAVVVTASHNPPAYNGYKVYLDRATQIIPPHDAAIAGWIARAPRTPEIERRPLAEAGAALVDATFVEDAYVDAVLGLRALDVPAGQLEIAYTALHGVGERLVRRVMERAGYTRFSSVEVQAAPDGRFPTVSFPNPEEPSALQRVLALGVRKKAHLVLANDPDADRLAVACPDADGRMTVLTGNEIGVLLGDHALRRSPAAPGSRRLVVSTIVSSPFLGVVARAAGAESRQVLTGFKWIANTALDEAARGAEFVFGYEEALGYTVGGVTRDKDGIGAALVMAELAASLHAQGQSLLDRLRELRQAHGYWVSRQKSLTYPGREGMERIRGAMKTLRAARPTALGGVDVLEGWDLGERLVWRGGDVEPRTEVPVTDALSFALEGDARVAVRPSGTEPKLKIYVDLAERWLPGESAAAVEARGYARADALVAAVMATAGLAPADG